MGKTMIIDRDMLWADIKPIHSSNLALSWTLVGDFNVCRFTNEKNGGNRLFYTQTPGVQ